MADEVIDTEMHILGLSQPGRSETARRAILALDACARISFEPEHELVRIASRAQALDLVDALSRAGLEPTATSG